MDTSFSFKSFPIYETFLPTHLCSLQYDIGPLSTDAVASNEIQIPINTKKIQKLAAAQIPVILEDAAGLPMILAPGTKSLHCLISSSSGTLTVDPWSIEDYRLDPTTGRVDPNFGSVIYVNANTPYPLRMDITRGQSAGIPRVGHPTLKVKIPYQTWLIGVNTLGAKFRPSVKDSSGKVYSANAIVGSINAGVSLGYSFGVTTFTHRSTTSWSLTPAFSLGMAATTLSKEPFLKKNVDVSKNPSNFILSPSLGLIVARNDIGLFVAYGHDLMMGKNADAWAYQHKRYLAIGLSASFKL